MCGVERAEVVVLHRSDLDKVGDTVGIIVRTWLSKPYKSLVEVNQANISLV